MIAILYDFIVIILFFLAFKFYDIYVATMVGIVGTALQVMIHRFMVGSFDKKQLLVLAIFVIFGGMTLYFHNPIFVKWKPSIVFWLFGIVILTSHFFFKQPIMQRLMSGALDKNKVIIPLVVWKRLNLAWGIFFMLMGAINIYIAYYYSTEAWVNFKLYGLLSAILLFAIGQSIYLSKYVENKKS